MSIFNFTVDYTGRYRLVENRVVKIKKKTSGFHYFDDSFQRVGMHSIIWFRGQIHKKIF